MTTPQYLSKLDHYINGAWVQPTSGKGEDVVNPATNQPIAKLGYASKADLDAAIKAADAGFKVWRKTSAFERAKILRKAAVSGARAPRSDRDRADFRAGEDSRRSQARDPGLGRCHRLVRR